jgi:hypothetical protein
MGGKKMELDLYPVNITDKMFKNKVLNEGGSIKAENLKNRSLDRLNDSVD